MSSQVEQQQPLNAYPYDQVMKSPPHSSHSNGSFNTTIIVIAGILFLGVTAYVLNRLCRPRGNNADKPKPPADNANGEKKPTVALQRADIESGFAYSHGGGGPVLPPQYGGGRGPAPPPQYGGGRGPVPPHFF
ncbi:anther-specific protein SF18-like [Salvia hispanica]|uniref:anther-specific protein SF18-like n=1 Tax=Salvia hispanica TaxID=49212 RepID=UPI0020091DF3|nr:anther-specific protein SF18-like [Salvia hispanica]